VWRVIAYDGYALARQTTLGITRLVFPILFASLAAACRQYNGSDSPTAPTKVTGSAPFSTTDLVVGTGAEATPGLRISVNYTGWLLQ
jgi:hypothetical protein